MLSRSGMGIVHPANGKLSCPGLPKVDLLCLYPNYLRGEVLIEGVMDLLIQCLSIGYKPSNKCGGLVSLRVDSLL